MSTPSSDECVPGSSAENKAASAPVNGGMADSAANVPAKGTPSVKSVTVELHESPGEMLVALWHSVKNKVARVFRTVAKDENVKVAEKNDGKMQLFERPEEMLAATLYSLYKKVVNLDSSVILVVIGGVTAYQLFRTKTFSSKPSSGSVKYSSHYFDRLTYD
mmetsp:Transcript_8979/g.26045  ORF Transcript_8979/g.26045 Transcript_8979/m.26045 type:complete len:162 (+) Transcript_8979:22-507(+)